MALRDSYQILDALITAYEAGLAYVSPPSGEAYSTLESGLAQAASEGKTEFTIICAVSHAPTILRMQTKYLDTFFSGIRAGLAAEHIFDYEIALELDDTDTTLTRIRFSFTF